MEKKIKSESEGLQISLANHKASLYEDHRHIKIYQKLLSIFPYV